MSYTNSTSNYHLPLPTDDDKSTWTDNNTAFAAIDSDLHDAVEGVSSLDARVSALEQGGSFDVIRARLDAIEAYLSKAVAIENELETTGITSGQYSKLTASTFTPYAVND